MAHSVKAVPQVLTLTLVDPTTHLTQTITCTPGHPFYVPGQGFVLAGSLGIGTSIVTRAGPCLSVTSIAYEPKSTGGVLVYNLTVQDDHTYFVGTLDGGTWVHNTSANVDGQGIFDLHVTKQLAFDFVGEEERHHIATHYDRSPRAYGRIFRPMFNRHGIDIEEDIDNTVMVPKAANKGPHLDVYHEWVKSHLDQATDGRSFRAQLRKMKSHISQNPSMINQGPYPRL